MKLPNLIKFEKTGIGIATMALGLVVTVQTNVNVAAATETPAVVPISATGLPSDAGLWTALMAAAHGNTTLLVELCGLVARKRAVNYPAHHF